MTERFYRKIERDLLGDDLSDVKHIPVKEVKIEVFSLQLDISSGDHLVGKHALKRDIQIPIEELGAAAASPSHYGHEAPCDDKGIIGSHKRDRRLKAEGKKITHKSDFGGVIVGIQDRKMLEEAVRTMEASLTRAGVSKDVDGFLVQEMARGGKEIILGMSTDEIFGPLLMFGMGGKYVEIIKDITFRVMPVTDVDAREMVKGIRSYPLLEGVRGERRVDIEFIVESIQRLGQMVNDLPGIVELDMNPVIVTPDRRHCRVVDSRIRVAAGA